MIKFELVMLNKNKVNAKGEAIIYLRLTQNRKAKYLATGESCLPIEWNENKREVRAKNIQYRKINTNIKNFKTSKESIYDNSLNTEQKENMSLDGFLELIKPKSNNVISTDFFELINFKINTLKDLGKMGTSKYYQDTLNSIRSFEKRNKLDLTLINYEWLKSYETYLKKNKCIETGISVRMRAIRSIFNDAIEKNYISLVYYPFKAYKISKLKGGKKIRSISDAEIQSIINIDVSINQKLQLTKDLFLFSYYTGGMNFIDMMLLTSKSIIDNGNRVEYTRSKTKGLFNLKLTPPAKAIINRYKLNASITGFVFPILNSNHKTPIQIANRRHKTITQLNKNLKEIGRLCNIDFDLTSYVARHSFATHLKQKNIATDIISEALGHQNIKVTQTYLKRFGNEVTDNALETLIH
jgi:site-specific recombinase XerD